jgi:hypothetical protein
MSYIVNSDSIFSSNIWLKCSKNLSCKIIACNYDAMWTYVLSSHGELFDGLVPRQDVAKNLIFNISLLSNAQTNSATDAELFLKSNYLDICHPYRANLL